MAVSDWKWGDKILKCSCDGGRREASVWRRRSLRCAGVDTLENSSKIKTMLESVEMGSRRPCYVNPADPGQAFPMRVRDPFAFIGSAVAAVLPAMGWFVLLNRPRNL